VQQGETINVKQGTIVSVTKREVVSVTWKTISNVKKGVVTTMRRNNMKREEESKYNMGFKLEFKPLFILVLRF
jgi:hypothetical protein